MDFLPNVSYTIDQLKEIAGDNYTIFLSSSPINQIPSTDKPVVYTYNDFNNTTKIIYNNIYSAIKNKNPDQNFLVFATGERVNGKWRTRQEVDQINTDYSVSMNYSPYEFFTNAPNQLTSTEISSISSDTYVSFNPNNDTHRIVIPPINE